MNDLAEIINNEAAFRVYVVQALQSLSYFKEDTERRVRRIEQCVWTAGGAIAILTILVKVWPK